MFWRFGFHNASNIETLLDKEDISLEAILDEDELLQECKAQNARLIDYFQRVDVLQRLLGYVTGQIEGEDKGRFKYPYVATEVLCSEIWSIVETCLAHSEQLLTPFWEIVLDRPPEDMKTQLIMASHFAKVNAVFLSKKPAEMLAFIQSQPNVVERLLRHIETPAFADLLVRVIQLDEVPSGAHVLEWLSSQGLMARLVDLLSPANSPDMHNVVSELVKGIISMAAPSPGAGLSENNSNGPASNLFARELAHRSIVARMINYILAPFPPPQKPLDDLNIGEDDLSRPEFPNTESATSSVVNTICIIIELIRQNNSDYFEPYLFHTLRNRLIQVQQQLQMHTQDGREQLENAMKEMVNRMGVVNLGSVLEIVCERLDTLQHYLREPRSAFGPVSTTVGQLTPLTFERYRICELYAELLHCSNMSLVNRPSEFDHLYDDEGRLQGGLSSLEELAQVISIGAGGERDADVFEEDEEDDMQSAHDFPVSGAHDVSSIDSDEDMSGEEPGSSDDDAMEEISMYDEPHSLSSSTGSLPENPLERFPPASLPPSSPASSPQQHRMNSASSSDSEHSTARPTSNSSRRSTRRSTTSESYHMSSIVLGERLKLRFMQANVASTLLDLFFEFPWNNFVHSVVYDLIHQVLTGRVDGGYNRELTISLFRDAHLFQRIIEGSHRNDLESEKPKGVRLGYMGHLTLISEDVIGALEHFPPDLRLLIAQYAPQPHWDEYVTGRYKETKKKDSSLLGGGKPVIAAGMRNGASQWKVDEAESSANAAATQAGEEGGLKGEFKRGAARREASADFGAVAIQDDDEEDFNSGGFSHFEQHLAQEMQGSDHMADEASSDDDDDVDEGWLARSHFELRPPPVAARQHENERRPLSSTGFDDSFDASTSSSGGPFTDPFDDDAFGPFSDLAAPSGQDPFNFPSAVNFEGPGDDGFDSFGDFGEFQAADSDGSGALTPTADSWSFASISSTGSEEGSIGRLSESPQDKDIRTA